MGMEQLFLVSRGVDAREVQRPWRALFGPEATWVSELFAARLRYRGASLGFQIGAALSGGLTPLVAEALIGWSGGATWSISLYLILLAAITLAAAVAAPETAGKPLS